MIGIITVERLANEISERESEKFSGRVEVTGYIRGNWHHLLRTKRSRGKCYENYGAVGVEDRKIGEMQIGLLQLVRQ